ncbi:hypothetical protein [Halorussus halobius]|uniref:hypothetical protein n=1 Tax=Halorussus halobius TaxID=1710537 RepID=UPI00109231ED|nr:hypothetical protein [Halorussus halobius]
MVVALFGTVALALATACGLAVYRTGHTRPVLRALLTLGVLLATPVVAFGLFAMTLTGGLPVAVAAVPIAVLGLGVYVIAEGSVPSVLRRDAAG